MVGCNVYAEHVDMVCLACMQKTVGCMGSARSVWYVGVLVML